MIGTIEDIEAIRPISKTIPSDRILTYIREAEELRVIPAITLSLYNKVNIYNDGNSPNNKELDILLYGGEWKDKCNGKLMMCWGLKKAVAYLAYSRLVTSQQINVTAFGVVNKMTDISVPVEHRAVKNESDETQKVGEHYLFTCAQYAHGGYSNPSRVIKQRIKIIGE